MVLKLKIKKKYFKEYIREVIDSTNSQDKIMGYSPFQCPLPHFPSFFLFFTDTAGTAFRFKGEGA